MTKPSNDKKGFKPVLVRIWGGVYGNTSDSFHPNRIKKELPSLNQKNEYTSPSVDIVSNKSLEIKLNIKNEHFIMKMHSESRAIQWQYFIPNDLYEIGETYALAFSSYRFWIHFNKFLPLYDKYIPPE